MKNILVVDDSALMRRVFSDIITKDGRFTVADEARDGKEALRLLESKSYDAVILDVNMPQMDGIELLKALKEKNIKAKILMASTTTMDGAQVTMEALELGALDFIHKPEWSFKCKEDAFSTEFLAALEAVCGANADVSAKIRPHVERVKDTSTTSSLTQIENMVRKEGAKIKGNRLVALAVSTGGPKSLQNVIPFLPEDLDAPVVLVQHMPVGFTASLAQRLDEMSRIKVSEAVEGETLEKGHVYISKGGAHMNVVKDATGKSKIHYTDEPTREGVKPCANYMYESLMSSQYDEIVCVVMTGMGADGTEGIKHLKEKKKIYCISQESSSCVVYGMPKSIDKAGLSDISVPLGNIAQEIILHVGVMKNGC